MGCEITKGIAFDCSTVVQGGVEAKIIVINHDDYLNATIVEDGTTKEITSITLPVGKQGWEFVVPKASNVIATSPLRRVDGQDGFDHSVDIRVATIEQVDAEMISGMRFNKVVVIVRLLEGRSKAYGQNVGLRLIEYDVNDSDPNTAATLRFVAQTDDKEASEIKVPQLIDRTFDLSTLLTPAV